MTKAKATSLFNQLSARCDDAFLLAIKVGSGCMSNARSKGDWKILLSLFLNLLDDVLHYLNGKHQYETREALCLALIKYLADTSTPSRDENLSDKQRRQRAKRTDFIVSQLEAVL